MRRAAGSLPHKPSHIFMIQGLFQQIINLIKCRNKKWLKNEIQSPTTQSILIIICIGNSLLPQFANTKNYTFYHLAVYFNSIKDEWLPYVKDKQKAVFHNNCMAVKAVFNITHMNTPSEWSDHYGGKTIPKMGCWFFF